MDIREVRAKWNMGAKWKTGCLGKRMLSVGLLLRPRDFDHWSMSRDTSKWNWYMTTLEIPHKTQFPHFHEVWCINSFTFRRRLLWWNKSQNRWLLLNRIIYFFIFSHHFDWKHDSIYSWHDACYTKAIPEAKWNMVCWGPITFLWGKNAEKKNPLELLLN